MKERNRLGISIELIEDSDAHAAVFKDDFISYMRGILKRMYSEQPNLFMYSLCANAEGGIHNDYLFSSGLTLSYDKIPRVHREEKLGIEHIEAMHRSLSEHSVENVINGRKIKEINLDWYYDKLQQDSPEYMKWLQDIMMFLNDDNDRSDFWMGATLGTLPFYMRAEARQLEETFSR